MGPVAEVEAWRASEVAVQLKTPPIAWAVGCSVEPVTTALAEAVAPLGLVPVTMYVPATVTFGLGKVDVKPLGPVQLNVTPGVGELADICATEWSQLNWPPVAVMRSTSLVTTAGALALQPPGLITVTV